jgi:tetratricopeptide (TPR) repeat protein
MVELSRVCEVYTEHNQANGPSRCGSGYLVTGRLVLTAGHAVGPAGTRGLVRCAGSGAALREGRVAWSQYGGETDEALLEITDPHWAAPADLPPVRWGRLVTSAAGIACEAAGFPDAQLRRSGDVVVMRDLAHVTGSINALDGAKWGILQISVASAAPAPAGPAASPWGGLSGAGVLCGALLTGVITQDADRYGGRRLNAVPTARLLDTPGFRDLLTKELGRAPVAEPVELEPFTSTAPPPRTPAALLRADVEAVGFRGREAVLDELATWCAVAGGYSVRLLTGPGGQGKTRLARELGRRMAAAGWAVLHLAPAPVGSVVDYGVLGALRGTIPILVIIDYAEARTGQVGEVVSQLTKGSAAARVLLLSRTAGEWQGELTAASTALDVAAPGYPVEIPLPPLAGDAAERGPVFAAALTDLSARLGALPGHDGVDWARAVTKVVAPDLSSSRYSTVLAVQMAALAALLTTGHGDGGPAGRPEDVVLAHEVRYWGRLAERRELKPADPDRVYRWLVAAASLCTAADENEAVAMIARLPGLGDPGSDGVRLAAARWLHDLYPERNLFCGSLQPDVLAEHLVGRVLADKPTVFDAVLADATEDQAHHGLTVLARAAVGRPQVAETIARVIVAWPAALASMAARVASETENPAPLAAALDELLASDAADPDLLEALNGGMPAHSEIHRDRAERVTARLVQLRRQRDLALRRKEPLRYALRPHRSTPESADLARALYSHGFSLAEVGKAEQSMDAYRESIAILRQLAKTDPDAGTAIAAAVNDLCLALAALGLHQEALAASEEALSVLREAIGIDPEVREYLIAVATMNRGKSLLERGRVEEGMDAFETAVSMLRRLPRERSTEHMLAVTTTNVSASLTFLGRSEEAVAAAREAVGMFRDLARSLPDQFTGNLALALINTSRVEADAGAVSASLAAAEEAIAILRPLSDAHREVFGPLLAMALMNHGAFSISTQPGNGLISLDESATLARGLAAARPAANNPQLAMSLINLAVAENYVGHTDRARDTAAEAVALAQVLAAENPEAFEPTLLHALDARADALAESGQVELAVAGVREAVAVWRRLAGQRPAAYEPRLVTALARLAQTLVSADQAEEALEAASEAVALGRRTAPSRDWAALGIAVAVFSETLSALGRHQEALAASDEAVRIFRAQNAANPGAFRSELANALSFKNSDLAELGRLEEAIPAGRESIEIYQELMAGQAETVEPKLARELLGAISQLGALGRTADALGRAVELVELRRATAAGGGPGDLANLARSLHTLSVRLSRVGQQAEAAAAQQESIALNRSLAKADPGRYRAVLAAGLTDLAESHVEVGEFAAAVAAMKEAVQLRQELAQADPDKYRAALGDALRNLAAYYSELGQYEQAYAVATEARALLEPGIAGGAADPGAQPEDGAQREDGAQSEDLARTMVIATIALAGLNRPAEALASAEEAMTLLRALERDGVAADAALLATAIRFRGFALAALGRADEAIAAAEEATSALRSLAQANPGDWRRTSLLAFSLQNLGKFLNDAGRYDEGLGATEEALALLRKLSGRGTSQFSQYIAMCLLNLSVSHLRLEQWQSAIRAADQALTSYRVLAGPDAVGYQAELADTLRNLGIGRAAVGQGPQAISAFSESVALYEQRAADGGDDVVEGVLADTRERLDQALEEFG